MGALFYIVRGQSIHKGFRKHESEDETKAIRDQVVGSVATAATGKYGSLEWTKPEVLYDGGSSPTQKSINLILFTSRINRPQTSLSLLPTEIQDRILRFTSYSTVAPAKLGCDLGLGPAFQWRDRRAPLVQELCKCKRLDTSPIESQIRFGSFMSGISYKPQLHKPIQTVPPEPTKLPPPFFV